MMVILLGDVRYLGIQILINCLIFLSAVCRLAFRNMLCVFVLYYMPIAKKTLSIVLRGICTTKFNNECFYSNVKDL